MHERTETSPLSSPSGFEPAYRAAFEIAPCASMIVDQSGRILDLNREVERFFARERTDLLGRTLDMLWSVDVRERCLSGLQRAFEEEHSITELPVYSDDGDLKSIELHVRRLRVPSTQVALCTFVDQHALQAAFAELETHKRAHAALEKRTAELLRSNGELEHFAYVVSHDLQEPVRMVASYTKLLEEDYGASLDENAKLYIHFAQSGAVHVNNLVAALLAYSRVGTRRKPPQPASVSECLAFAVSSLQVIIERNRALVSSDPLPLVMSDKAQLVELLQNLIGNAIKFCATDTPEIHVSAERYGKMWRLSVRDNGIGIAPEHCAEVFQVFRRLHAREEYEGTGMGLAIAKKIVEQHGGEIWVESELGKGSTFHSTFHACADEPQP